MASAASTSTFILRPSFKTFSPHLQITVNLNIEEVCGLVNVNVNHRRRSSIRRDKRRRLCCSQVRIEQDTDEEACDLVNGVEVLIGEGYDDIAVVAYLLTMVKNNNETGVL
ncbi:hypothetical protein QVD17_39442 [Tagetes erecta]|uniref:Uncharacterized protein n=1 Tax=Tagetes erecta TaxID=13708 RepID=A0AAD8JU23_TARER|nr:hypothetical protein QVD17_39442 [Tagetes erecta]